MNYRPTIACLAAVGVLFAGCSGNSSIERGDKSSLNAYFDTLDDSQLFPDLEAEQDYWLRGGLTVCHFLGLTHTTTEHAVEQLTRQLEEDGRGSASDRAAFVVQSAVTNLCPEEHD